MAASNDLVRAALQARFDVEAKWAAMDHDGKIAGTGNERLHTETAKEVVRMTRKASRRNQ